MGYFKNLDDRPKRPKKARSEYVAPTFKGFIDPYISSEMLEQQKRTPLEPEDAFNELLRLIECGFAVRFIYDHKNSCFQATMTPQSPTHEWAGMYLVGRGSCPMKALKQLLFKHHHILKSEWSEDFLKTTREDYE